MSQNIQNGFLDGNTLNFGDFNGQNLPLQPALAISLYSNIQNGINTNQRAYQQNFNMNPLNLVSSTLNGNNLQNFPQQLANLEANTALLQLASQRSRLKMPQSPIFHNNNNLTSPMIRNDTRRASLAASTTNSLIQLQNIALDGCKSASQIYLDHSKRPYFKKIDVLIDRLRQDLLDTNKAVANNVNSHGIAWAVKDFIFVFIRVIGAWTIVRNYFYTESDSLQCVRDEIDPDLVQNFFVWQDATIKFMNSLKNSFEKLNLRNLRNGNRRVIPQSSAPTGNGQHQNSSNPMKNFFDVPIIDGEEDQRSGAYLKTAIYKPLKTADISSSKNVNNVSIEGPQEIEPFKFLFGENLMDESERNGKPLYERKVKM